jgi:predicted  nucleic acid-binding Zn-ribbon protein
MKVEIETAKKAAAESTVALAASEEKVQALAAEMAPVEGRLKEMQGQLATAEQAVQAASGVVESRRQTLRPLLQLTSVK